MKQIKTYQDFTNEEIDWKKGIATAALGASLAISSPSYSKGKEMVDKIETVVSKQQSQDVLLDSILKEIKSRLDNFTIDGFMDSGVIEQLTNDNDLSPFPQYMTTERPDRAAQFLLNGHVVVLVDNSPIALVLPVNFSSFMKTSDPATSLEELVSELKSKSQLTQ